MWRPTNRRTASCEPTNRRTLSSDFVSTQPLSSMYSFFCLAIITATVIGCASDDVEIDATITTDDTAATTEARVDTVVAPIKHDTIVQPSTTVPSNSDTSATTGG